jgi:GNAT superfamily N-acetyltransferase
MRIARVTEADLDDLLPLVRAYLDFYEVDPARVTDEHQLAISRALLADPDLEGRQLIAREDDGRAVGFATLYWVWSTTQGGRIGLMNDLFVAPDARGKRYADALIEACRAECAQRGALSLWWQTAPDNRRAQAVYDRVGGTAERWVDYSLRVADD